MVYFNNRYISSYRILFCLVDAVLLFSAAALGIYFRFLIQEFSISLPYCLVRNLFFVFVFQLSLYLFELYDLKIIHDRARLSFRVVESVTTSVMILMILYYMFPILKLGRGILLLSAGFATAELFFWRIIYRHIVRGSQLSERIIILGTGEFAREIAREIQEKRDSGFEVIGHIDTKKESLPKVFSRTSRTTINTRRENSAV